MLQKQKTLFGFREIETEAEKAQISFILLPGKHACKTTPSTEDIVLCGKTLSSNASDLDIEYFNNTSATIDYDQFPLPENGLKVNELVYNKTMFAIKKNQIPVLISEDHSTTFGAIEAISKKIHMINIFHISPNLCKKLDNENEWDAKQVMLNITSRISNIQNVIHVGTEDILPEEIEYCCTLNNAKNRNNQFGGILEGVGKTYTGVWLNHNQNILDKKIQGQPWLQICDEIIKPCKENIWLSIDLSILNQTNTITYGELVFLIKKLVINNHKIVGIDFIRPEYIKNDPYITAKLIKKLVGFAAISQNILKWKEPVEI